jgi:D-alanyl-lipoteichoic acid acyltransferase DltB (MBOAT superfamily)
VNVPSYEFLGFAALVALLINCSAAPLWRCGVLLVANAAFLLSFSPDPVRLVPFLGFIAFGYAGVKLAERCKRGEGFAALTVGALALFCWLKQYAFVPHGMFLPFTYMTVGLSYVFFRVVHLIVDAFQGSLPGRVGLVSYLNYTLNFTSLVSGPIQLYPEYRRTESEQPAPLDASVAGAALERIIVGLFKVSVASPLLFWAHGRCITLLSASVLSIERIADAAVLLAVFPVYLYMNFSGYTDCVIGVGRFLRLELPENFDRPFAARGFIDFWGRWHMSLSNWFKTYVYSPLLMELMRRFPSADVQPFLGVFVYFVTFFLVGVWHGQTTMFLFYGVLQGVGVSVNKVYQILMTKRLGRARYRDLCARPLYASLSRGMTFGWFAFTLLWFWSSWGQLGAFVALLGWPAVVLAVGLLVVGAALVLSAMEGARERFARGADSVPFLTSRYMRTAWCTALIGITLSLTVVLNAPAPHIVYKGF